MRQALTREIQELRLLVGSARDPDGRVFAQLGDALRRNGELSEALSVLREGVAQHPHFAPGHLALAWAAQESGRLDEALSGYREALALDPENPFGLFGAGSLLQAKGDPGGTDMVARALELHPGIPGLAPGGSDAGRSLEELPYMSLAELAPARDSVSEALQGLPFMALAQLAPEDPTGMRRAEDVGIDLLPFVPLTELAPDWIEEELPFVPLSDLAPEPAYPMMPPPPTETAPAEDEAEREDEAEEPVDATPVTRTMAELFVRQGLMDRAVQIYERLREQHPDDASVAERLGELRTGEGWISEESGTELGAPAHGGGGEGERHHHALAVPEPEHLAPSPYGWAVEGEEVLDTGPGQRSAGAYFGRLLAWTPGNPAREADEAASPQPPGGPLLEEG